jgi:hypothetical protein
MNNLSGRFPMIARCLSFDPGGDPRVDPDTRSLDAGS